MESARWSNVRRRTAAMAMAALPGAVETPGFHVWPCLIGLRQTASQWVCHDVMPFLAVAIVTSDTMVEGRRLPSDPAAVASCSFKPASRMCDADRFWNDCYDMHVVWHG
jgi:hypothetical protein